MFDASELQKLSDVKETLKTQLLDIGGLIR